MDTFNTKLFLSVFYIIMATFMLIGVKLFKEPWKKEIVWPPEEKKSFITKFVNNMRYFNIQVAIFIAIIIQNYSHPWVIDYTPDRTAMIQKIDGDFVYRLQTTLRSGILDEFFSFVYAWNYTFILFFTVLFLISMYDRKNLRRYTNALVINYAIMMPFYILFPVRTTGMVIEGMTSIFYDNPAYMAITGAVDPLDNCFPSGHISVTRIAYLIMRDRKDLKIYRWFCSCSLAVLTVAVLYLGIHWWIDVPAGALVGIFSIWAVDKTKFMDKMDKFIDRYFLKAGKILDKAIANGIKIK